MFYNANMSKNNKIPIQLHKVQAGFPSPADNYIEKELNIQEYLVKNKEATFLVRATGESMIDAGIFPGDILVVDRSLEPKNNSIIIASIDGELTVKTFIKDNFNRLKYLKSENINYPRINLDQNSNVLIWGVVTHSIHHLS